MTLKDRISERLEATGLSAQAASLRAGLSRDAVRNILRGRSSGANMTTLAALAPVLGVSVSWLAGQDDGPDDGGNRVKGSVLPVLHEVGSGYWVAPSQTNPMTNTSAMVMANPVFADFPQWLERVIGVDFDLEYPPGTLIHVVDAQAIGYAPRQGDHVVIETKRHGGLEVERCIREVVLTPEGPRYWPRSHSPRWQEPLQLGSRDGQTSQVVGLILGSYRPRAP